MHTPGPWAVETRPQEGTSWFPDVTVYETNRGTRIADACILQSKYRENARLMAKAPAMLELLKDLVEVVWMVPPGWECEQDAVIQKAQDLISEIEGEP